MSVIHLIETKPQLPKPSGRCLDSRFLGGLLRSLSSIFGISTDRLNRHELQIPHLLAQATADNDATLDLGDIGGDPLWKEFRSLICVMDGMRPATDGDLLYIRYGGGGSWWSDANYHYSVSLIGVIPNVYTGTVETAVPCWFDHANYRQGNDATLEAAHGEVQIALAQSSGQNSSRNLWGSLTWADMSSAPYVCVLTGRYTTTSHISAIRLYYKYGNIYGTAQLWGIPRGTGLLSG